MDELNLPEIVANLWRLAKHWDICAENAKSDTEVEVYNRCAKQLRQRAQWIDEGLSQEPVSQFRHQIVAMLESLMNAGWIERFTLVDNTVKIWHSQSGSERANDLLAALPQHDRGQPASETQVLQLLCSWLLEQHSGTSPSYHLAERPQSDIAFEDQAFEF